jgi:DNA-binding response OmpR family regulator
MWRERAPDLVILDIGLPRKDGWEVCRAIRTESTTPIMILSGNDSEDDVLRGLDLGAEDYMTKPFSPRVLQARVRSLLRRSQVSMTQPGSASLQVADLTLDSEWRTIANKTKTLRLTKLEYRVLHLLALHFGQVVAHNNLIEHIWGYKGEASSNIVKGHIRNVRVKLQEMESSATIKIVPGVGYLLTSQTS